ncbi:MAG: XrtA/PEP-CTERM system TPR-repeat protein PrsT [Burkholderiaceae bacterium]
MKNRKYSLLSRTLAASLVAAAVTACSGTDAPDVLLSKAESALQSKDLKAAEIHLKNLLQQQENNASARFMLAELYRQAHDLRGAEKEYRRARDAGYDRNKVTPALMEVMLRLGDLKSVVEESRNLPLADAESQARALTAVGWAYLRQGEPDRARKAFADATGASANHLPAQVGAAAVLARSDRPAARRAVDQILAGSADSVEALALKADLEIADLKLKEARELLRKVVERTPLEIEPRAKLVSLDLDLRDPDAAKADLEALRKIAPSAPITHYLRASYEVRQNNLPAARDAVQEALRLAPEYLPAVALAASVNLSLNSLEQAERNARLLIERSPDNVQGYRVLGATYLKMNAPDRALEAVRPLLARANDATLLSIAGEAALKMNDPSAAAGYFDRAAKLNPQDARSKTGLALSHLASGDASRGVSELEEAVKLDSGNLQADVALIMAHVRERKFDNALTAVDRMEKKAPKNPLPWTLRGAVLAAKNDLKGARSALSRALELDPTFFPAATSLANMDMRDGRPADARKRYEDLLAKDPKNSQAAVALAGLSARTGAPRDQVLGELKKARETNPDSVLPIIATGRYMIESNTPRDAIPMLQEAVNRNPQNTQLLDTLAMAFLRTDQRAQAIDSWEKILRVDPKAVIAHLKIGETHLLGKDPTAALQSYRKAAEIAPQAVEPQAGIAVSLSQLGRRDEAMKVAARLRANDQTKFAGTLLEGDLFANEQKWPEASDRYRAAFAQQKTLAVGFKAHRALRAAKRESDADNFLRDWLRAEPNNLPLRLYAGETELGRQRWKESFEHYAVVIEKEPKNALALNNAAWSLHQLKDPRAADYAKRSYDSAPKAPPIIDTYGMILAEKGDKKGVELLREAVKLAPNEGQYRLHLAEALVRTGDKNGARQEIDALLKATPDGPLAEKAKTIRASL